MKKEKKKSFRLLPGFALYVLLLVFSILFTQFLRSRASNMLLWFVVALPFLSLVYTLLGRAALQVYVSCSTERTEKNTPTEYEIRIINSSFLPYPFVEAVLSEPADSAARCEGRQIVLSLVSFGGYIVKKSVSFKYRGYYEIGVDSIHIRDFFGFFETVLDVSNLVGVSVFPRVPATERVGELSASDAPSLSKRSFDASETIEASDIKDYAPGDPVKSIHWKLSSKTEELKVRQYTSGEKKHVYILCDLAEASMPPENDSDEIYAVLKQAVLSRKKDRKNKIKIEKNSFADKNASGETSERASFFEDIKEDFALKRRKAKYKRNIKSGMSHENAELVDLIDSFIKSGSKSVKRQRRKRGKLPPSESPDAPRGDNSAQLLKQDLERILASVGEEYSDADDISKAYGGRVKPEYTEDYDELCADAVCEIALSAVLCEVKKGNSCTLMWFDSRSDGGVASFDISCGAEFDAAYARLAGAKCAPAGTYVSGLAAVISDTSDVTVKTATANIDPVSLSELSRIPAFFGGSGAGCVSEVLLFSPDERFEIPSVRRAYVDDAASALLRSGIRMTQLSERESRAGEVYLEAVTR